MDEPRFIHLKVHSDYSIIDGLIKIDALIKKSVDLKIPALAITDFTNLFGLVKFYNAAHNAGIKPIIGADFLVRSEVLVNTSELTEITILAANNIGYHNLILLISEAYQYGYSSIGPVIYKDWLIKYNEGLILLSGACKGDVGRYLLCKNRQKLEKCLSFYQNYFPDRYYLEIIRTGRLNEEHYLNEAVELAINKNLPIVATNDVRFISSDDFEAHEIRVAIHNGYTLHDTKRPKNYSSQQYMRSEQEMCNLFSDLPDALTNSVEIARRCNVIICFGEYFLPKFSTGNITTENYLVNHSKKGLEKRLEFIFPNVDEKLKNRSYYDNRLHLELNVINQMGFSGYFLIVMEFIKWAQDNDVPVGPGRGSGSGSLVAYALKITNINPLEFNLLFERFLNPDRVSMPDFDIDFCMEKRDLVIDHIENTYGRDAVSQIITFGTMTAKSVIRDVGRVLGYPYGFVDKIAKLVPLDVGMTLEKSLIIESHLKMIYDSDEEVKSIIDMARKLEGIVRNAGKHAGGIVISPTKITDFSPLYCDSKGSHPVTQFDKNDVEYIGLVKFDLLGLRTLTIIDLALKMINSRRIQKKLDPIDISRISLEDKQSFDILKRSETTAVFQLESRGMKDLIKRLQPDCFEDIIALVALFRPGPLQSGMVDNFINRKHRREKISYPDIKWQHELLKPVLESTYGIILYQEQVMQIAQTLAGYSLGEADILRRAMGKKKQEDMAKQRSIFRSRAESLGVDGELSMKIFNLVEKFAGYGFNKSHSSAYAFISYQTLWLKAHYPSEFMAAVMTSDMSNTDRIIGLVNECRNMGLNVLPPDINNSQYHFYVNPKGDIVYGIGAIKGIGEGPTKEIINVRNKKGCFQELFELCCRINLKKINRRILEKFILSGSFDCLGTHRAALMHNLSNAIKAANQHTMSKITGQKDIFNIISEKELLSVKKLYYNVPVWSEKITLKGERETLGFYLINHPVTRYLKEIKNYSGGIRIKDLYTINCGKIITIIGLVISVKEMITKKGSRICILTLDDHSGRLDIVLFEEILKKYHNFLKKDRILIVQGHLNFNNFNSDFKLQAKTLVDIGEKFGDVS